MSIKLNSDGTRALADANLTKHGLLVAVTEYQSILGLDDDGHLAYVITVDGSCMKVIYAWSFNDRICYTFFSMPIAVFDYMARLIDDEKYNAVYAVKYVAESLWSFFTIQANFDLMTSYKETYILEEAMTEVCWLWDQQSWND